MNLTNQLYFFVFYQIEIEWCGGPSAVILSKGSPQFVFLVSNLRTRQDRNLTHLDFSKSLCGIGHHLSSNRHLFRYLNELEAKSLADFEAKFYRDEREGLLLVAQKDLTILL